MKDLAYHCTSTNPNMILDEGFSRGLNGYTEDNMFEDQYEEFLPQVPVFVSNINQKVWDKDAKHCLKIDISGLKKYPDFGNLYEQGADLYVDEDYFWFENINDMANQKLRKWIEMNFGDDAIPFKHFSGDVSWELLGTCTVDAVELNKKPKHGIVDIRSKE